MSEVFNFSRFGKYFVYDLKQMGRHNGRTAILIGFFSFILYILWVTGSLVFTRAWHGPVIEARAAAFCFAALALSLCQTRTYGYLTEKQAGSAWLLIPASKAEKFVSMMLMTLIVLPAAFLIVYLLTDWLIAIADPTVGDALAGSASRLIQEFNGVLKAAGEEGFSVTWTSLLIPAVLGLFSNLLYFLLCGLIFKRWKIAGAFAILFGLQFLLVNIAGLTVQGWDAEMLLNVDSPQQALDRALLFAGMANLILIIALMALIFFRIKTLKH